MLLVNLAKTSSSKSNDNENIYKDNDYQPESVEDSNSIQDNSDADLDFEGMKISSFANNSRRKSAITSSSDGISGAPSDVPKVSK